ncbi:uncharacterized protein DUF1569 [Gelidibacter algens]|uniref:Uncharacterized protein DUF1569 n=1 Tax=Gelidibacter algens TaxID=49280 RepID=A0A1A7QZN3_9FLAO|nr:DUF1569 domain-containing protein [Gelidibacter algens]OBX24679.1 hypothetical protein A9996_14210 [Gelidibacter algens]RAJ20844.1 uncharacterized protein DUF1569 [Gelidibacter algens]
MQTLFDQKVHQEVLRRVDSLTENSKPSWGKMDVAQMVRHCQLPLLVANGKMELTEKVGLLKKMIFKLYKPVMYNDKPWPENIATTKDFKVTDPQVFETQRNQLKLTIDDFHNKALNMHWPKHPVFGKFSTDQWGKMQYKHLDHHLRQFGV